MVERTSAFITALSILFIVSNRHKPATVMSIEITLIPSNIIKPQICLNPGPLVTGPPADGPTISFSARFFPGVQS
jgi:hypothetical protein